jgi:hypothetical protein
MKKLIASLLTAAAFVAPAAHATDLATLPNRDGGLIVLTDVVGNCENGRRMYVTGSGGNVSARGCYLARDPWVYVQYDYETQVRQYPAENFLLTPAARAAVNRATASSN